MDQLLDMAAVVTATPRERLSFAKPPTVGSKSLTAATIASLKWDEPKLIACPKVGSYPLQLRDGDLLLFRDSSSAASAATVPTSVGSMGGGRGKAKGAGKRGGAGGGAAVVVVAGGRGRERREEGLSIQTCYDVAPSEAQPPTESAT